MNCRRRDPAMRDVVDWIVKQVLFHDMRVEHARYKFEKLGVPEHVFNRLLGVTA